MAEEKQLLDILQIINTPGIGPVSFYNYVKIAGDVAGALHEVAKKKEICSRSFAEEQLALAKDKNISIIAYTDKEYPQNLLQLNDAPPVIYVAGNIELLNYPVAISIVGARNASIAGRKIASRIAYELTENDVLIISGMARGIDSSAHKGALYAKNQKGPTIAVLGTGVDEIYPAENADLYYSILQNGTIISEFALGTKAQMSNFPRRNRIISALSSGTLVVEAGLNSGSLITARLALEQGKEVFAVPGSPLENRAAGPNQLIKEGAILTENAQDILNVLSIQRNSLLKKQKIASFTLDKVKNSVNIPKHEVSEPTPSQAVELLQLISYEGVDIDELFRNSGLPQAEFFSELLNLEFSGRIERHPGNKVARIK